MDSSIIIVIALFVVFIIVAIVLSKGSNPKSAAWKTKASENLSKLYPALKSNDKHVLKSLLIDLDKLLDFCMREYGVKGETMGERLKNAGRLFNKDLYNKIWRAHKTRNQMVHEIDYSIMTAELRKSAYDMVEGIKKLI